VTGYPISQPIFADQLAACLKKVAVVVITTPELRIRTMQKRWGLHRSRADYPQSQADPGAQSAHRLRDYP
jgi:hypothetical protein